MKNRKKSPDRRGKSPSRRDSPGKGKGGGNALFDQIPGLLSATVEQSTEGMAVSDLDGHILFVNRAFAAMHGYRPEELLGRHLSVFHNEEQVPAVEAANRQIRETGQFSGEVWHVRADGTPFPGLMQNTLLRDETGNPIGMIGTLRDVTDLKKMEQELIHTLKLESLGLLAGGIAHDFNNILTAILSNIAIVRMHGNLNGELLARIRDAERACLRAKGLTGQLLTFSRDGAPLNKKTSSISALLRETAGFSLSGSNVRCEFSLPEDLWFVEMDEVQISQVINNLVLNADQAMPGGGILRISAENLPVGQGGPLPLPEGKYVRVLIEDQGVGIPFQDLHRIFDLYFTTKKKGTGLGLSISYAIVKKHGGHIQLESEPGRGTRVSLYLPASEAGPARKEELPDSQKTGGARILIMDDDEMIRQATGGLLERLGYEVELAREGGEAVESIRRAKESGRPFDAVIMDLTVPGAMGGEEAAKEALAVDPAVKIIVCSGYSHNPVLANFREHGFCGVVRKPYTIRKLTETLQRVIQGREGPGG